MPLPDVAEDLLDRFRDWLRDRRQPITPQRDLIARLVFSSDTHLSAEDIAGRLRAENEQVGTATIYRSLEVLVESGLVRAHDFGEGFRRYEALEEGTPHGHLICSRCGAVTEFPLERLGRSLPLLADEHEFVAARFRVEVHGLCSDCRQNEIGSLAQAGST